MIKPRNIRAFHPLQRFPLTSRTQLNFPTHRINSSLYSRPSNFSTTTKMASLPSNDQFIELMKQRRSVYTLSPESTISDSELQKILEATLEEAPSTFGSFTTRIVTVVKEEHFKLWDIIIDVVKAVTPAEQWESSTKPRLDGFRNAYGTVLFFEDPENTRALQDKFAFAKDKFPIWSQHTSAIHQYIIWTALSNAGLGANLQHYNPLPDERIKTTYDIPEGWELVAQMVFGKPTDPAGPKPTGMKKPLSERLRIIGA